MIKLYYGNNSFKLIGELSYTKSSREVTFNSVTIDFTGYTIDDLPVKYQEVKIKENNKVLFTGFINTYKLPSLKNENELRQLEIELISPMAMTTNRSVYFVGTYNLKTLIPLIIQPLIDDGFELVEDNYSDHQMTVNFMLETIENCLNKISTNYNIWWYIDENKGIHINDISYQFGLEPAIIYNNTNNITGLYELTPSIDSTDYCNVVNFKNVRTYQLSADYQYTSGNTTYSVKKNVLFDRTKKINNGDSIDFNYPVVVDFEKAFNNMQTISTTNEYSKTRGAVLKIDYTLSNGSTGTVGINFITNSSGDYTGITFTSNLKWEGTGSESTSSSLWELRKDSFFSNLAVGLKYNGTTSITSISSVYSCNVLVYTNYKFIDNKEITKCKNKVSNTGQIEKTVDLNEQWKSINELNTIAKSYIAVNSSQADEVTLKVRRTEEDLIINVGDVVQINKPNFYLKNDYIVTDLSITYTGIVKYWSMKLRNKNYLDSYIDLFRATETQESEDKLISVIIGNYIEEGAKERHEVVK